MDIFLCGFGYPGRDILKILLESKNKVAVFTHTDLPNAPGLTSLASKRACWSTSRNVNDTTVWPFEPEFIISIYYRHIIKPEIVKRFEGRIINVHPSLLPKHRGCSSIPWAMIEGDTHTGMTYHYIDEGIDTGNIILQESISIMSYDTQLTLSKKINRLVVDNFSAAFNLAINGDPGSKQIGESSYHPRQVPYDRQIDPNWATSKVERFIRAMIYPPYPPALFCGREIRTLAEYEEVLKEGIYEF